MNGGRKKSIAGLKFDEDFKQGIPQALFIDGYNYRQIGEKYKLETSIVARKISPLNLTKGDKNPDSKQVGEFQMPVLSAAQKLALCGKWATQQGVK